MPVVRVPVQHKFGIVSLSRAEQLLARSNYRREQKDKARSPPSHQLNQAFIIKVIIILNLLKLVAIYRIPVINLQSFLHIMATCLSWSLYFLCVFTKSVQGREHSAKCVCAIAPYRSI